MWVGFYRVLGLDASTGVFMLLYLDLAIAERKAEGRLTTDEDLTEAIVEGAARRLRPKLMTVATAFFGLLPVMFQSAAGSEIMQHMAAPMIGGSTTLFLLELTHCPGAVPEACRSNPFLHLGTPLPAVLPARPSMTRVRWSPAVSKRTSVNWVLQNRQDAVVTRQASKHFLPCASRR